MVMVRSVAEGGVSAGQGGGEDEPDGGEEEKVGIHWL